jgi:tetratricopeptide (TPR) repeat protein
MRLLAIAILVMTSVTARAETDVIVLGPATADRVSQRTSEDVVAAIKRIPLPRNAVAIDRTCAADTSCLVTNAPDAKRALSLSVSEVGKRVEIELVLVDVAARELIAKRDVSLATRKVERELGPLVKRFLEEAPVERAKELFAKGNQHYELGELTQALELYRRAYQIKPLVAFLFNIAQCHRKLGQHKEAITMYQSYLVGVPDAENKALVESLIAESKAALEAGDRRESERLAAERAEQLRKAREAEALAAKERRRTEQVKSKRKVLPWFAIGLGAAAIIGGATLYLTSETDDGTQPTYRDSRPAGIGVAIGGGVLAGTGLLWVARF